MTKEEVLKQCTVDGFIVKLPKQQLDRKLYLEVAKSLELIGGKWKGNKVMGFVFNENPSELLKQISNGKNRNIKKEYQFFATPDKISDYLVELAKIKTDDSILEPSAGQGSIIDAILRTNVKNDIFYIEHMPTNLLILHNKYKNIDNVNYLNGVLNDDFLNNKTKFDKIIANPPFNKNQDITHIRHMYDCLNFGGRLVSIASTHWIQSLNNKEKEFRQWLDDVNADIFNIEAGAFKESGTLINTVIIVIDK